MNLRVCENCRETADDARAFCPGCGDPFVAEKRRSEDSEFEMSGNTVQFSKSAFNMVLSDMGLNISEVPNRVQKSIASEPTVPVKPPAIASPARKAESGGATKWIVIAGAVGVVVIAVLIAAAAAGFYFYAKPT